MSFNAIDILALIPVLVSVIAIFVAKGAVTRSLRPVLVFVCEVRDKVWCVQNVGTGPRWMFWLPRKTETNSRGLGLCGCRPYRRMQKSVCDRPRVFWRLPTTTLRTTLIRRSAQDTGIDFGRAMFLIEPMRTRLLWIHMNNRNDVRNVHDCRSCVSLHRRGEASLSIFRLKRRVHASALAALLSIPIPASTTATGT